MSHRLRTEAPIRTKAPGERGGRLPTRTHWNTQGNPSTPAGLKNQTHPGPPRPLVTRKGKNKTSKIQPRGGGADPPAPQGGREAVPGERPPVRICAYCTVSTGSGTGRRRTIIYINPAGGKRPGSTVGVVITTSYKLVQRDQWAGKDPLTPRRTPARTMKK